MSRMTVRATAREMQTTPRVERTFTGWANGKYPDGNGHVLTRIIPNLNLLILQIFIVNFTEKYEPNKLLRSSEDSFYILLQKVKDKKIETLNHLLLDTRYNISIDQK